MPAKKKTETALELATLPVELEVVAPKAPRVRNVVDKKTEELKTVKAQIHDLFETVNTLQNDIAFKMQELAEMRTALRKANDVAAINTAVINNVKQMLASAHMSIELATRKEG